MKKIGILFGQENSFPLAFVERVNSKKVSGIEAEFVKINQVIGGEPTKYSVILDRISQDVPFYRGYLKNAAIAGTAVINNPFWWSADEKFFNIALAAKLKVPVPKTVLLPSNQHPQNTIEMSFRNLDYPLDWEYIFNYVTFPAFIKPFIGGGWKHVYKLNNPEEFFQAYNETGQFVMMLQEAIEFEEYFKCYCIGLKDVRIMRCDPYISSQEKYIKNPLPVEAKLLKKIEKYAITLNKALGYDFNAVEFAIRNGIPYAISFCNPAPDIDIISVGEENFDWVVEALANITIERAKKQKIGAANLTWGEFILNAVSKSAPKVK
jgi:glutathione synthase/RimK-type ligase-like ATP-grasp enzyme